MKSEGENVMRKREKKEEDSSDWGNESDCIYQFFTVVAVIASHSKKTIIMISIPTCWAV